MGLFIPSLLIVMIVKSQAGLQVASSGNQETVSCDQDIIVDKLDVILSDYLEMVNTEVRNTKYQVEELKGTLTDTREALSSEQEATRRKMDELQVAVSGNQETVSSELEDTRRKVDELQVTVSGNQEMVSSELKDTRLKVDELQVSVYALVKLLNNDAPPTTTDATVTTTEGVLPPDVIDPPTHVLVQFTGPNSFIVSWEPSDHPVIGYTLAYSGGILRVDGGATYVEVVSNSPINQRHFAMGLYSQTAAGYSRSVETFTILNPVDAPSDPRPPTNVRVQFQSPHNFTVVWDPPAEPVDGYLLTYSGGKRRVHIDGGATSVVVVSQEEINPNGFSIGMYSHTADGYSSNVDGFVILDKGSPLTLPKDCSDILATGVSMSGVYTVRPRNSSEAFQVYCDMETDGGGWTVFQRRKDGSVDFYLDFASYSRGFGNLEEEFWLGNGNLHRLTAQGEYELRVDLEGFDKGTGYAVYDSFSIADVSDNYRLTVGTYSGTAGNGLDYHYGMAFSTKDQDNDRDDADSCAKTYHGAWWYAFCQTSNLNGRYYNWASIGKEGIVWASFSNYRALKTTEMKIRSKI